jgi:hypothetical protein
MRRFERRFDADFDAVKGERDPSRSRCGVSRPALSAFVHFDKNVFGGTPNTASGTLALPFPFRIRTSQLFLCFRIMAQEVKSVQLMVSRIFLTPNPCKHGSKRVSRAFLSSMFY